MPGAKKICPCGSGKLYEKCCGKRKVYSLVQAKWRRVGQELRRSLGEFADQPSFAWDAARAQDIYLGCLEQQLVDRDDDFTMERCFEWFIFDYKLSCGRTIIEEFRSEHLHVLRDYEAVLLREWARSRIAVYEVTGVIPGEGLRIKELQGRREITVRDVNAAAEIKAGSILLIRILKVGEEYEFSTGGLALPGESKEPLLKWLIQDRQEYFKEKKAAVRGWNSYLKERAHKINAWVLGFGLSNTRPGGDSSGLDLTALKAILPVRNWQVALKIIKQSHSLIPIRELKDRSGVFRQMVSAILGTPRCRNKLNKANFTGNGMSGGVKDDNEACLRPVLGQMVLTQRFIVINAISPGLLLKCRDLLIDLFEGIIEESPNCKKSQPGVLNGQTDASSDDQLKNSGEEDNYSWPEPGYAVVAGHVRDGLEALGYSQKQQRGALKLWFDYCSKERPSIRKDAVWAATVIYAFSRLEMENCLKQQDLAGRYGVASSTISSRYRLLCESLELVAYDRRYSTKKPPTAGLRGNRPLNSRLFDKHK